MLDERIDPERLEMMLPAHRVREVHSYLIPQNVQSALSRWNPTDVEPGDSLRPFLYWADDLVAGRKSPAEARIALLDEYIFQSLLFAFGFRWRRSWGVSVKGSLFHAIKMAHRKPKTPVRTFDFDLAARGRFDVSHHVVEV